MTSLTARRIRYGVGPDLICQPGPFTQVLMVPLRTAHILALPDSRRSNVSHPHPPPHSPQSLLFQVPSGMGTVPRVLLVKWNAREHRFQAL